MSVLRRAYLLAATLMPKSLKPTIYRLLGWKVGRNVRIGFSYLDGNDVTLGDNVAIGNFNIFRQLKRLHIGDNTQILNFNEFFGIDYGAEWAGELLIGESVQIMSRHFIDVAGSVVIGDRVLIAGRETQIWSHQLGLVDGVSRLMPRNVCIGEGVSIGARSLLLGCSIPTGSIVGMGSVVTKSFAREDCRMLIAGNPAGVKKRYPNKLL